MVPRNLWARAESLSGLGVDEVAWSANDAVQVLELLGATEIAVLGGHVYVKRAGQLEPNYDNWYAERDTQETLTGFAARSWSIAREYLANLMKPGAAECWVSLILSDPMEPPEEDDDDDFPRRILQSLVELVRPLDSVLASSPQSPGTARKSS